MGQDNNTALAKPYNLLPFLTLGQPVPVLLQALPELMCGQAHYIEVGAFNSGNAGQAHPFLYAIASGLIVRFILINVKVNFLPAKVSYMYFGFILKSILAALG